MQLFIQANIYSKLSNILVYAYFKPHPFPDSATDPGFLPIPINTQPSQGTLVIIISNDTHFMNQWRYTKSSISWLFLFFPINN